MGYIGDASHEIVIDAISRGIHKIRAASKFAGLLCLDETRVAHFIECGANFVGVGVDTLLLGDKARALAARYGSGGA